MTENSPKPTRYSKRTTWMLLFLLLAAMFTIGYAERGFEGGIVNVAYAILGLVLGYLL